MNTTQQSFAATFRRISDSLLPGAEFVRIPEDLRKAGIAISLRPETTAGQANSAPHPCARTIIPAYSKSSQALKSEYRSAKSETNSNDRNPKFKTKEPMGRRFGIYEHWNFEFVSNFDIGISNLPFERFFEWRLIPTLAFCALLLAVASSPCFAQAPVIDNNGGASGINTNSATLNGNVLSQGGATDTVVRIYWGPTDGGTNAGSWSNSVNMGILPVGAFSTNTYQLTPNTLYYYRAWASNAAGIAWAPSTTDFRTLNPDDIDADGMLDSWEIAYLGGTNAMPNADLDGDGFISLNEYIAGTDPTDAASYLALDNLTLTNSSTVSLSWNTVAGRLYNIQVCTNGLASGNWINVAGNIPGTGAMIMITNALSSARETYYRVTIDKVMSVNNVISVNILGIIRHDVPENNYVLLSYPFHTIKGAPPVASNFFAGASSGARIYSWNTSSQTFNQETRARSGWMPNTNEFYPGKGFIYESLGATSVYLYLIGEVPMSSSNATPVANGWNLLAYPYPSTVPINDMSMYVQGARSASAYGLGDEIRTGVSTSLEPFTFTNTYWLNEDGAWRKLPETSGTADSLRSGEAFWYFATNSFTWSEIRPYPDDGLPAMEPLIILNLPATAVAGSSAALNGRLWSSGATNAAAVTVYWGPSDGGTNAGSWSNAVNMGVLSVGSFSTNTYQLTTNTLYYYRCFASNSSGTAWASASTNFTTLTGATAPAINNAFGATGITTNFATFNGNLTTTGGVPTTVRIYWGPSNGGTNAAAWSNVIDLGVLPVGSFSTNTYHLTPNTLYYYRSWASNAAGIAWATPSATNFRTLKLPLEIMTDTLPTGIEMTAYNATLRATNGTPPYTWSVAPQIAAWGGNNYGQANAPTGLTNVVALAVGGSHSLALRANGTVAAWGNNYYGQTNVPANLSNVVAIAAGGNHSLALRADGTVAAWGYNGSGQTNVPAGLSNVVAIAAGESHSLALRADGTITAWGDNRYGQANVPSGLSNVTAIAAGESHSLALRADGTVAVWGRNNYGQTNVLAGLSNVVAIAAGSYHNLALRADGTVAVWGYNGYGQTNVPTGLSNVVAITGGWSHSLALRADGTVVTWGAELNMPAGLSNVVAIAAGRGYSLALRGSNTRLPDGLVLSTNGVISGTPTLVGTNLVSFVVQDAVGATTNKTLRIVVESNPNTRPVIDASAPPQGVASMDENSALAFAVTAHDPEGQQLSYTWTWDGAPVGGNSSNYVHFAPWGAIGPHELRCYISDDSWTNNVYATWRVTVRDIPLEITTATLPSGIEMAPYDVTMGATNGTPPYLWSVSPQIAVWRGNDYGQANAPTNLTNAVAIAAGAYHSLALRADGTVVAWGENIFGQTNVPPGLTNVTAIAAGYYDSLALRADGTVAAWGLFYELGFANVPAYLSNVVAIAAGKSHDLALRSDGTVVAWVGDGDGQTNVPQGLTNVVAIAAGYYHSVALHANGTVTAWGDNSYGQASVPAGLSNIVAIAAGGRHNLALRGGNTRLPDGLVLSTNGVISGTPTLVGTNLVAFVVRDAVGASTNKMLEMVIAPNPNRRPVISSNSPLAGAFSMLEATNQLFQVWAYDPEGSNLTYAWTYDGAGVGGNADSYTHTTALGDAGLHTIRCYVSDDFWSNIVYAQWNVRVLDPNDIDYDGLPDWWEMQYFGNLGQTGTGDPDNDGWTNLQEYQNGTNPAMAPPAINNAAGATGITTNSATFNGNLTTTGGVPTTVRIYWGLSNGGTNAAAWSNVIDLGVLPVGSFSTNAYHLTPNTLYYYRAWASNAAGIAWAPPSATNFRTLKLPLEITTDTLPSGMEMTAYNATLQATNGTPPYTWSVAPQIAAWGKNNYGQVNVSANLTNIMAIAAGNSHNLALRANGTVAAWGYNGFGQANATTNLSNVVAIAAGGNHSLALRADGTVAAFGDNLYGQVNVPANLSNVVAIAGGFYHSLALRANGAVAAWGRNDYGQTNVPANLSNVVAIAGGFYHSLALRADGMVAAWGRNYHGQTNVPANLSNVVAIAVGWDHNLALRADGMIAAWGYNGYGQTNVPAGLSNVVAIAAGEYHSLALRSDGTVAAWGYNGYGQTNVPTGLSNVVAIAAGGSHNLALCGSNMRLPDGLVLSTNGVVSGTPILAGTNFVTFVVQDAVGTTTNKPMTIVVEPNPNSRPVIDARAPPQGVASMDENSALAFAVAARDPEGQQLSYTWTWDDAPVGGNSSNYVHFAPWGVSGWHELRCYISDDFWTNVYAMWWVTVRDVPLEITTDTLPSGVEMVAYNATLQATNGTPPYSWSVAPHVVAWGSQTNVPAGLSSVTAIAAGGGHSLVLRANGTVAAWGDNGYGQTNVPANLTNVTAIAAGGYHSLALRTNGTVAAWGWNYYGQANVPTGLSNIVAIAAGGWHGLALRADGTVAAWGANYDGQANVPTGLSNAVAIAGGYYHSMALRADGTVAAWGDNFYGQTNVPTGLSNAVAIAGGYYHSLVLRADGTIVVWGNNGSGQTNVPAGLSNVVAIAAGGDHSLALRTDGTVAAWGLNDSGQTNVPANLSNIVAIAAGWGHSLALRGANTRLPDGLVFSTNGVISGTPTLVGTNFVTFVVQDAVGASTNKPLEIVIAPNPNRRPVISSNSPPAGAFSMLEATNQLFQVWAYNPDGGNLTYAWTYDGAGVGGNAGSYTHTTALSDTGLHTLRCYVSDDFWSNIVYAQWNVRVLDPNDIDYDGLPDWWETQWFENTTTADAITDYDGDGQTDLQEYRNGTNPTQGIPSVSNTGGASNITATSVTLRGNLTSTGGLPTIARIYWGPTDGGTNAAAWANVVDMGVLPVGLFSTNTYHLSPNTLYYYRAWASNAAGIAWAIGTVNFITMPARWQGWFELDTDDIALAGKWLTLTVTAKRPDGGTDSNYTGTVQFRCEDQGADALTNYTFLSSDRGVAVISNAARFANGGVWELEVRDTVKSDMSGDTDVEVLVGGAPATTHFRLEVTPQPVLSNRFYDVFIVALGDGGLVNTNHSAPVIFSSSDPLREFAYTNFSAFNHGMAFIPDQARPRTPGEQTLRVELTGNTNVFDEEELIVLGGGTYYYVSATTGSDMRNGLGVGSAWATIGKATTQNLLPGDVVIVAPGSYHESVTLTNIMAGAGRIGLVGDKEGRYFGYGFRGEVEVSHTNAGPAFNLTSNTSLVIAGFAIRGGPTNGSDGIRARGCSDIILFDNEIEAVYRGIALDNSRDVTALNNTIEDGGDYGLSVENGCHGLVVEGNEISEFGTALLVSGSTNVSIMRNEIAENREDGIAILSDARADVFDNRIAGNNGFGLKIAYSNAWADARNNVILNNTNCAIYLGNAAPNSLIINNTCYNNKDGIKIVGTAGVVVRNNIFAFNQAAGIYADTTSTNGLSNSYNCVFGNAGNWAGAADQGPGSISADPLFASITPYHEDLHLLSTVGRLTANGWIVDEVNSPCIDSGDPTDQYDNETMPNGGRINLGAYGNTWQASRSFVGSVRVIVGPPPANAVGAQWRMTRGPDTTWKNSGDVVAGVSGAGAPYTIEFKDIPDWTRPPDITAILITHDATTTVTGFYEAADMALIKGGAFQMGADTNAHGGHTVILDDFLIDCKEVTIFKFQAYCNATTNIMPPQPSWAYSNPALPVVNVTWQEASDYAAYAGKRLPTEAEFEYVMRGGQAYNQAYPWPGNTGDVTKANYALSVGQPTNVASYPTNDFGVHDIGGNVWEWCSDWHTNVLTGPATNPVGPPTGRLKAIRGGSWAGSLATLRCWARYSQGPDVRYADLGFRCVNTNRIADATSISNTDANGNGVPDWWESWHFGTGTFNASADSDGDGMINWQEYVAGTSPTNSDSVLTIQTANPATNTFVIRWPSAQGKFYTIERTINLNAGFTPHITGIPATPPMNAYTDTVGTAAQFFYRVKVE